MRLRNFRRPYWHVPMVTVMLQCKFASDASFKRPGWGRHREATMQKDDSYIKIELMCTHIKFGSIHDQSQNKYQGYNVRADAYNFIVYTIKVEINIRANTMKY